MWFFTKYIYAILDKYRIHEPLELTTAVGFTGGAGERPPACATPEISDACLLFGATTIITNANVLVRIKSISPQYEWMGDNQPTPQDTPIHAIFGISTQAMPVLPMVQPAFLEPQGKLQMQFTNAALSPVTGGTVTWRGVRLRGPIDGGWNYVLGFNA